MAEQDWKSRLGVVFSTNPDFKYDIPVEEEEETLAPSAQKLIVSIDRRNRGGKQVTLVKGFRGKESDLETLAKKFEDKMRSGWECKRWRNRHSG